MKYQKDLYVADLIENKKGIQILTDSGFSNFDGVINKGIQETVYVYLEKEMYIQCTKDHEVYTSNLSKIEANKLKKGDEVYTTEGILKVLNIAEAGTCVVYDIRNVEKNNRFIANGILVSNCQFIAFEETLIASSTLAQLEGKSPKRTDQHVRWYKDIDPNCTYVLGLDPSMGTGGDNAAIQVWELPSLRQVAEWQHNKTRIEDQVALLRTIGKYIESQGDPEIYWSVENNTLGEAALVVIRDTGEDHFAGSMLHDPSSKGVRRRKGYTTTPRTKQEACAMLKRLTENKQLEINSKALISELKTFVYRGGTYAARNGTTDDLVMALVLVLRMSDFIAKWEDTTSAALSSNLAFDEEEDDEDSPMPLAFI